MEQNKKDFTVLISMRKETVRGFDFEGQWHEKTYDARLLEIKFSSSEEDFDISFANALYSEKVLNRVNYTEHMYLDLIESFQSYTRVVGEIEISGETKEIRPDLCERIRPGYMKATWYTDKRFILECLPKQYRRFNWLLMGKPDPGPQAITKENGEA